MTLMPPKKQSRRSTFFDLRHGLHGLLAHAGTTQPDDEDGGIVFAKQEFLHIGGQHLHRDGRVYHIAEPERLQYAWDGVDVLFHGQQLMGGQALHGDHAGGSELIVVFQNELAHPGVQLRRQVGEDVVVDAGGNGSHRRGDQEQNCEDQDHFPQPDNGLRDFFS